MATGQSSSQGTYARVADLALEIEDVELEVLTHTFSPGFTRVTTRVTLRGRGRRGTGEDVTPFQPAHQGAAQLADRPVLRGRFTLARFGRRLDELDLYPGADLPPLFPRTFRQWAFESAALDLALRQAGASLSALLRRESHPMRFVNSPVLGTDPLRVVSRRLEVQPTLRFKLDPSPAWTDDVVSTLAATGAVDVVDLKGQYPPEAPVAVKPDGALYARIARGLPDVWLEDPGLSDGCRDALEPHLNRITWDLPVRDPDDIDALPIAPRAINIKPARHGTLRRLFDVYDLCDARGLTMYGGGMGEIGPGRTQNQYLASLFHPDAPNDLAPVAYNESELAPGLPPSPLVLPTPAAGLTPTAK
ncbi:MAG: hypothetical protein JO262_03620 [Solirubrobacterales bacterium]|nr:hypothetical protein [Solirubrobacterales bacterium]MBV9941197.1 hypothetical protein [Solirubrobacterales bacterium]